MCPSFGRLAGAVFHLCSIPEREARPLTDTLTYTRSSPWLPFSYTHALTVHGGRARISPGTRTHFDTLTHVATLILLLLLILLILLQLIIFATTIATATAFAPIMTTGTLLLLRLTTNY